MPKQRLRPYRITQPPPGHRIGLAPAVEQDQPVAQRRVAKKADVLGAVVKDLPVDFVAEYGDLRMPFEPGDQPVELVARHNAARRVGRAVDDDEPGARRDLVEDLVGAEREARRLVQRDRHRRRSRKPDHALVNREPGVGVEDLDPRLAEHQDAEEHRDLGAGNDQDQVRRHLDPMAAQQIGRDRRTQRRDPVRRRVPVMSVGERLATGLDDMLGGREIRLADAEIDDRATLGGERIGAGQHLERGLGPKNTYASGHLQHHVLLAYSIAVRLAQLWSTST